MRRRVLSDGVEFPGSDPLLIGLEQRLVIGIQLPDGQIHGHYVEVVDSTQLSYRSLGLVEEEVAEAAMIMMAQVG